MPISTTAARCHWPSSFWRRRSNVRGTPMSLLKLPWVAKAPSPTQARRMLAIICVTVVLPLLPVTAIKGRLLRARQAPASCIKAWRVSATTRPGICSACSDTAATAPAACACGKKLCASKRSPFKATKRSPGCKLRVSVCTRPKPSAASPTNSQARSRSRKASAASPRVQFTGRPFRSRRFWPAQRRRRNAARHGLLGNPHALCQR
jgi:hypothetical protein